MDEIEVIKGCMELPYYEGLEKIFLNNFTTRKKVNIFPMILAVKKSNIKIKESILKMAKSCSYQDEMEKNPYGIAPMV